jgi:predicted component of type VI protein secretion system
MDNNSRNGTYLDGIRLAPGQSYRLREHNRIRLGRLSLEIDIQNPASDGETPAAK